MITILCLDYFTAVQPMTVGVPINAAIGRALGAAAAKSNLINWTDDLRQKNPIKYVYFLVYGWVNETRHSNIIY